ncbi:MAG: hypothetical protein IPM21_04890 [Acidobacteria bacterium]|nr:hypothetical protein [Acidobacteriota bacterium]
MKDLLLLFMICAVGALNITCQRPPMNNESDTARQIDDKMAVHCSGTEQMRFDMEDHAVCEKKQLPPIIWQQIVESDASRVLKSQLTKSKDPSEWVEAGQIDINLDGNLDYVVVAVAPPLAGPSVTPFWVFLYGPSGYECVLSTTASSLEFSSRPTNGFRDIKASWVSGDEYTNSTFHFEKGKYRLKKSETRKIE